MWHEGELVRSLVKEIDRSDGQEEHQSKMRRVQIREAN